MNEPLSFIERGGVPPKTVPVADLVINPQRAYAADAPQNVELINLSAYQPSAAILAQVKGQLRFVDQIG